LKSGLKVILDATNVNTKLRRNFMQSIEEQIPILHKKAILFDISPEESIKRIKNHKDWNIKRPNVPDEIVYRMYGEYLYTKKVISLENWHSISVLTQD
jgi:predicted kinase